MAFGKRRRSRKTRSTKRRRGGNQRARFATAAKGAIDACLKKIASGKVSATRSGYGSCMRTEMKARL